MIIFKVQTLAYILMIVVRLALLQGHPKKKDIKNTFNNPLKTKKHIYPNEVMFLIWNNWDLVLQVSLSLRYSRGN